MDLRQSRRQNTRCPAFGCLIACPPDTLLPERNPLLDTATKKRIDDCRDILVGKVPDPKSVHVCYQLTPSIRTNELSKKP